MSDHPFFNSKNENAVVAFKNAKVSDFNGKTLNCSDESTDFMIEPNHPRTLEL